MNFLKKSLCCCLSAFIAGCGASIGSFSTFAEVQTQLNKANYKIVQTGVSGSASCIYFLSIPCGDMEIHKNAIAELKSKQELAGRSLALVNVTRDISVIDMIIASKITVTYTADIIEFEEEKNPD
jgi:uncharacterized protein YqfA (UPF0365 family)